MKNNPATDLVLQREAEALISDRGLLIYPRPTVNRERLEEHLREALRLLHVDLDNENVRDTPRRWADSLVTMTSGYDFTDTKRLTTLFRKACSAAASPVSAPARGICTCVGRALRKCSSVLL